MAALPPPLLLLLLSIEVLMFSCYAQGESNYDQLPESYKRGVDLTLEKLHSHAGIQAHFVFLRSLLKTDVEAGFGVQHIYHHFYLKATDCPRGTVDSAACRHRNDRPLMDCAVCYKMFMDNIEPEPKPYIHCVHKPSLTQEVTAAREQHCSRMGYRSGLMTLLASQGEA